jgi:hypothetical protein
VGLVGRLLPVVLLVGVFVLALGTFTSGGAFQAGALVAAGLFLLYLAGAPINRLLAGRGGALLLSPVRRRSWSPPSPGWRSACTLSNFAPRWAGAAIVAVETAVTVSIVVTLVVLLIAAAPDVEERERRETR